MILGILFRTGYGIDVLAVQMLQPLKIHIRSVCYQDTSFRDIHSFSHLHLMSFSLGKMEENGQNKSLQMSASPVFCLDKKCFTFEELVASLSC